MLEQRLLEWAIKGLESQRAQLDEELTELQGRHKPSQPPNASNRQSAPRTKRGISAAGRKRIAVATKRRWALAKKAGKTNL